MKQEVAPASFVSKVPGNSFERCGRIAAERRDIYSAATDLHLFVEEDIDRSVFYKHYVPTTRLSGITSP